MNPAEPKKRGPLFWVLLVGGCIAGVFVLCCIGSVVLFGLGDTVSSEPSTGAPATTASADAAERWVIAYEVGRGKDFTQSLPGGRWVALFGIEMDIHDRAAIRSGSGKRNSQGELYELTFDDEAYALKHVKRSVMGFVATGVEMTETGSWERSGTTLTLTPETQIINDFVGTMDQPRPDHDLLPRSFQIVDLALEPRDQRMEATGPKFLGALLSGPTPFGDDRNPFVLQLQRVR